MTSSLTVRTPETAIATPIVMTEQRRQRLAERVRTAKSPSTLRAYKAALRSFARWCDQEGASNCPAAPETVACYLDDSAAEGASVSTLRQRLAAIGWMHSAGDLESPTSNLLVRETMRSIRTEKGIKPKQAKPATSSRVLAMASHTPETLAGSRDRALLLFGFASAMRRSELVGLTLDDLTFTEQGVEIDLRRSKTDQDGKGHIRAIPYGKSPESCPVSAVSSWLANAEITEGAVFRSIDRHGNLGARTQGRTVDRIVKRYAKAAKLEDAPTFGAHSLRAGFITSAAEAGKPVDRIMDHTGHKSHAMIRLYTRREDAWKDNAGSGLL